MPIEEEKMNKKSRLALIFIIFGLFSTFIMGNSLQLDLWNENLDVPYVPTPLPVVQEMLRLADLKKEDIVYDLGCGDGRILIEAASQYGVKGYGVDIDAERIKESRKNAKAAGVDHLVEFYEQDLFQTDIRDASVVMLYLLSSVNLELRPKLLKELRPGTKVISHDFDMNEWLPDKTATVSVRGDTHRVYYWVIPANITGNWNLKSNDFPPEINSSLHFHQIFQFPQGEIITEDRKYNLTEVQLKGNRISFSAKIEKVSLNFHGYVLEDQMQGIAYKEVSDEKYRWKASRDPQTKEPLELMSSQEKSGSDCSPF